MYIYHSLLVRYFGDLPFTPFVHAYDPPKCWCASVQFFILLKKKPKRVIFLFIWILFTSSCFEAILDNFSNISEEELSVKASILPSTERRYNQSLKTFLVRIGKPKH